MTNYKHNSKYNYNYDAFFQENEISYYLLGAFMTDGCIQSNGPTDRKTSWKATISSKDADWLIIMRKYICPKMKIGQGNQVQTLSICDKEIGEWFISKGCVPRKSLILQYPNIPNKYFRDFLRGCIDGDGSISQITNKKNGKVIYSCYLCSASLPFLETISLKLLKLCIKNSICQVNKKPCKIGNRLIIPKNNHYRLTFGSRATYKLMQLLYYSNHKLSMPRKFNKANEVIDYYQILE